MNCLSGEPEICVPIRNRLKFEMAIHLTEEGLRVVKGGACAVMFNRRILCNFFNLLPISS
jgi:hypothetical protein